MFRALSLKRKRKKQESGEEGRGPGPASSPRTVLLLLPPWGQTPCECAPPLACPQGPSGTVGAGRKGQANRPLCSCPL